MEGQLCILAAAKAGMANAPPMNTAKAINDFFMRKTPFLYLFRTKESR
jgi:hypothetical protein